MSGDPLGPLHGIPISIKDFNATKCIRTTNGSLIYKDLVPESDALVTERIRKSGAIILGKTNTPEFGHKGVTDSLLTGISNQIDATSTAVTMSNDTGVPGVSISGSLSCTYTFTDDGSDGTLTLGNGGVSQTGTAMLANATPETGLSLLHS